MWCIVIKIRHIRKNSLLVDTLGKTLNKLKAYLASFWGCYQTSPALQKALINI